MLHVVVLVRSVFVPDEISDESLYYESVSAQLLEEVALASEHGVVLGYFQLFLGFLCLETSLMLLERWGWGISILDLAIFCYF